MDNANNSGSFWDFNWFTSEWAQASAMFLGAMVSGIQAYDSHKMQKQASQEQKDAQLRAAQEQKAADIRAETQRLEALKTNQTATDYGDIWGADSNKFVDAAQKLSAGTGSFDTDDDETNPFYYRGLL